jgi:cytidyltransferase-like protein
MNFGYLAHAFDLFNVRDLDLIDEARQRCSHLIVGVFSDEFATQILGRQPIVPLEERMALVRHVRGVAEVVAHDNEEAPFGLECTRFSLPDYAHLSHAQNAVILKPTRESRSAALREVLRPKETTEGAVA